MCASETQVCCIIYNKDSGKDAISHMDPELVTLHIYLCAQLSFAIHSHISLQKVTVTDDLPSHLL